MANLKYRNMKKLLLLLVVVMFGLSSYGQKGEEETFGGYKSLVKYDEEGTIIGSIDGDTDDFVVTVFYDNNSWWMYPLRKDRLVSWMYTPIEKIEHTTYIKITTREGVNFYIFKEKDLIIFEDENYKFRSRGSHAYMTYLYSGEENDPRTERIYPDKDEEIISRQLYKRR